jgi:hypothetical protein
MDVTWLPDAQRRPRRIAVGEFDGVHLGHREVMRGADTVLTFEPHPRTVVSPDSAPLLLTTLAAKADLIAGLGVRELVVIPFDGAFAARAPQEFIDHVLVEQLGAEHVSVGANFRFGHRARGDAALLQAQGRVRDRVSSSWSRSTATVVSSSLIRGLISAGDVEDAERVPRLPVPAARGRRPRRQAGPHARLSRRRTSSPTRRSSIRATASTHAVPRSSSTESGSGGRRPTNVGRPAHLRHRPRAARGGLPARLRRRPLRARAPARVPRAACAASCASTRSRH